MKKLISMILVILMTVCLLAGCSDSKTAEESKKPATEKKITLDSGYWVIESMTMEGTEFTSKEIEELFGKPDTVMALAFSKEGKVSGVLFAENFDATYTGTLEKFEIKLPDEVLKGSYSKEKMVITLQDGSKMVLVYQEEMPESIASNPWSTYKPEFSAEQTRAMSNFIMYGHYWVEDNVIYGLSHSAGLQGAFAAIPFNMKGDFPEFKEAKILDDRGVATYVNKVGDVLYYVMNEEEICRINTDGSGRETLYKGACDYMQIHNDRIYFTDEKYHFVSTDMKGKDLKEVVNKEIYYPYFISSDWIIFQDDADSESLHLYNTKFGEELNITYVKSYSPIMNGKYLYYIDESDGDKYLCRIDMSDPDKFLCERSENTLTYSDYVIDGKDIYLPNDTRVSLDKWQDVEFTDEAFEEMEVYLSDAYNIYHKFDKDALISGKYLISNTESGATSFK